MPQRKKKVLIVLAVGSLVLVWRLYGLAAKYAPSAAQAGGEAATAQSFQPAAPAQPPVSGAILEGRLAMQQMIAEKPWGRDPFEGVAAVADVESAPVQEAAPLRAAPPAPALVVTGVSQSNGAWLAAINGNIFRVGDTIENSFTLHQVTRSGVALEAQGWIYTYNLGGAPPKIRRMGENHE